MSSAIYQTALQKLMTAGVPFGMARAIGTESHGLTGPFRSLISASVDPLPSSPSMGDSYIALSGQFATQIAVFGSDGSWHYQAPYEGDLAYVQDIGAYYQFVNSAWAIWGGGNSGKVLTLTGPTSHTINAGDSWIVCVTTAGVVSLTGPTPSTLANLDVTVAILGVATNPVEFTGNLDGVAVAPNTLLAFDNQTIGLKALSTTWKTH